MYCPSIFTNSNRFLNRLCSANFWNKSINSVLNVPKEPYRYGPLSNRYLLSPQLINHKIKSLIITPCSGEKRILKLGLFLNTASCTALSFTNSLNCSTASCASISCSLWPSNLARVRRSANTVSEYARMASIFGWCAVFAVTLAFMERCKSSNVLPLAALRAISFMSALLLI